MQCVLRYLMILFLLSLFLTAPANVLRSQDGHKKTTEDVPKNKDPLPIDKAISKRLVKLDAVGHGLESLDVTLESQSDEIIMVFIPIATVFISKNQSTQNMITRVQTTVTLWRRGSAVNVAMPVACASMRRSTPGNDDHFFTVIVHPSATPLGKLIASKDFQDAPFKIQQFCIWTITDNPPPLGYVGIGVWGFGSGPDEAELRDMLAIFRNANIPATKFLALKGIRPELKKKE